MSLVRKLSLIATLACVAALTAAGLAFGASGARDLFNNHENGDSNPLVSGTTYRASLFPIAVRLHPADRLWEGAQFLRTSGPHEGEQRTGSNYAFVQLLHKYAHDAQGKISNWGRGTITFEQGGIAQYAALGHSLKYIAYELGWTSSRRSETSRLCALQGIPG